MNLLETLRNAEVVCKDCGTKYGKYSVGCSSCYIGTCDVCGEQKSITEVRDYGYLSKGIHAEQTRLNGGTDVLTGDPILSDKELDDALTPSYEDGEITLKLTEEEVDFLNSWLDKVNDLSGPEEVEVWETVSQKVYELYNDYCVKYELSAAMKAYHAKYGTFGIGEDEQRWEGFRDAFAMLQGESND